MCSDLIRILSSVSVYYTRLPVLKGLAVVRKSADFQAKKKEGFKTLLLFRLVFKRIA
jgi:hypothetical protein